MYFILDFSVSCCIFFKNTKGYITIMKLTTNETKRRQVVRAIIKNIKNGTIQPGDRLATIRDMSTHFGVSFSVIQKALQELLSDGFIECLGASGYYIRKDLPTEKFSGTDSENQQNTAKAPAEEKIYLSANHHSDLVWRYPYAEYKKIREEQLKHLLMLAKKYKHFHFAVEQAEILRVYLNDHPEDNDFIRKLFSEGRLEIFGGFCIPDLNMISGESITRNFLSGRKIYKELLGKTPEVACLADAFGMSVQLPQILGNCGFRYLVPGRMPNRPKDMKDHEPFQWCGPDGSIVTTVAGVQDITHLGYNCNVPIIRSEEEQLVHAVNSLKYTEGNRLFHYMTEEGYIKEELFWILEAVNKTPGRTVAFGRNEDYFDAVAQNDLPVFYGEFNPTFSGCYTTRITVKQEMRKAENNLFKADFFNAAANKNCDLEELWRELFRVQFHDGACGCHHDAPHIEIMEKLAKVNTQSRKYFPTAAKDDFSLTSFTKTSMKQFIGTNNVVPEGVTAQIDSDGKTYFTADISQISSRNYKKSAAVPAQPVKCNAKFKTDFFEADFSTPFPVIRNLNGENVFGTDHFGEIIFRPDFGTMWTENLIGINHGHKRQTEKVVSIEEGPVFFKAVTEGEVNFVASGNGNEGNQWPYFESLKFTKEYIFPKNTEYFKLKVKLDWHGNNTKIAIRFPSAIEVNNSVATYEVPYGTIVRKPYFEVKNTFASTLQELTSNGDYITAKGDWPALNWVNYSDFIKGLTVANNGTPGHQLVNGDIIVSLIRSGTAIRDGAMIPQKGAYDNGEHEYEFLIMPCSQKDMGKSCSLGQMLNRPLEITAPVADETPYLDYDAENIQLSAIYQDSGNLIVRLYETLGADTVITLNGKLFENKIICEADMSGNIRGTLEPTITFRPFEIRTLILKNK